MESSEKRSIELRVRIRPAEAEALRELAARDAETNVSMLVRRAIARYVEDAEATDRKRKGRA